MHHANYVDFNLSKQLMNYSLVGCFILSLELMWILIHICREIARMLANDYRKRVMIVDTSNEIGGDGDIPHAGIGSARRMQVPDSEMQHKVLAAMKCS